MMEEVKYIPVKEFAERAGVSTQAIYKQTRNTASRLQPYISRKGKHTYISVSALTEIYNVGIINQPEEPTKTNQSNDKATPEVEKQPQSQPTKEQPIPYLVEYVDYLKTENNQLKNQIETLNRIIQEKDKVNAEQAKQLANLTQSLIELSNRALTTTTNQQQLSAMDKQPIFDNVEQPRKGFINRLFSKKERN